MTPETPQQRADRLLLDYRAALADASTAYRASHDGATADASTAYRASHDGATADASTAYRASHDEATADASTTYRASHDEATADASTTYRAAYDAASAAWADSLADVGMTVEQYDQAVMAARQRLHPSDCRCSVCAPSDGPAAPPQRHERLCWLIITLVGFYALWSAIR